MLAHALTAQLLTIAMILALVTADVDPGILQFIAEADVEVPNDPYRGEINIPGEILYIHVYNIDGFTAAIL